MSDLSFERKGSRLILPDISTETRPQARGSLDAVGMDEIEMPVKVAVGGEVLTLPAKVQVAVSIDRSDQRGIHMSRLYRGLRDKLPKEPLTPTFLHDLLVKLLKTQEGSHSAQLRIEMDLPLKVQSLKSGEEGWRYYPLLWSLTQQNGDSRCELTFQILYSSTCPCSAALARDLQAKKFAQSFDGQDLVSVDQVKEWLQQEENMGGSAHAQRSQAEISLEWRDEALVGSVDKLISQCEKVLATPVQAAVKREDEQEFARLNAANLMFCEDAARKLKKWLEGESRVQDYRVRVEHFESLHPHNAVAEVASENYF